MLSIRISIAYKVYTINYDLYKGRKYYNDLCSQDSCQRAFSISLRSWTINTVPLFAQVVDNNLMIDTKLSEMIRGFDAG